MTPITASIPAPSVLADGEGETLAARGTTVTIKVATPRVSMTDHTIPGGFPGPPLHVHPGFDEVFVVLEGTLALRAGEDVHELAAGGTAFVAGATPHTFANPSEAPARFLTVMTPGGFEDYFRAMAAGDEAAVAAVSARVGYAPAASA